jgi:hypothetical protein
MATVMAEVAERGRFELPRDESLAVFKPDAPVRGAWTVSVKEVGVGRRVMAKVMAGGTEDGRDAT